MNSEFCCNHVIYIGSLADNEMGPTNRITEEVKAILQSSGIGFKHERIHSTEDLEILLTSIASDSANGKQRPILHFDAHGHIEDDLRISGEESYYDWHKLLDKLRHINICTKNNLVAIGTSCYSLALVKSISIRRASPFYILLAAKGEVTNGYLEDNITNFYRTLFTSGSIACAFSSHLQDNFSYIHSEKILFNALAVYNNNFCKGGGLRDRKEFLLTEVLQGKQQSNKNPKELRKLIKEGIRLSNDRIAYYQRTFLIGRKCNFTIDNLKE